MHSISILAVLLGAAPAYAQSSAAALPALRELAGGVPGAVVAVKDTGAADNATVKKPKPKPKPCSAKLDLPIFAGLLQQDAELSREQIERLLVATCVGLGKCAPEAEFDALRAITISDAGIFGRSNTEYFVNTIKHYVEGHSPAHQPSRRIRPVSSWALRPALTFGEFADLLQGSAPGSVL